MKKWWLNVNKQNNIKYNLLSQNELNDSESNLTCVESIQHFNNTEENMLSSDFEDMHLVSTFFFFYLQYFCMYVGKFWEKKINP